MSEQPLAARPVNLTVEELALELRTTPDTVYHWLKVGKAPASFKVGRRRLFARADVDRWIADAQKVGA